MKNILLFALIIAANTCFAQEVSSGKGLNNLKFTIDTVLINGDKIPVQYINPGKLQKYKTGQNNDENLTVGGIELLQQSLEACRDRVAKGSEPFPNAILDAHKGLKDIKNHHYNIYIDGYIAELSYYDNIKKKKDSEVARMAIEQGEKEQAIIDQKAAEKKRISDSVAAVVLAQQQKEEAERQIAQAKEDSISKIEQAKQARAYEAEVYRKFGRAMGNHILANEVVLGMSKTMCEYAWGYPEDINRTIVTGMVSEQWVYGDGRYLYFRNGVLKSIQD